MTPAHTVQEAAILLKVGRQKIYELIDNGQFDAFKIGHRTLRIESESLHRLMAPKSELGKAIVEVTTAPAAFERMKAWAPSLRAEESAGSDRG